MASQDGWAGSGSVDPAFAELFRAEDSPAVPAPSLDAGLVEHSEPPAVAPQALVNEPDDVPDLPVAADPSIDTGRLFRSQGVVSGSTAVLALTSDHGGRLRTLSRTDAEAAPVPAALPKSDPSLQAPDDDGLLAPDGAAEARAPRESRRPRARGADGLTALAVYVLIFGVTLIAAFMNALILNGKVGWPTGLALVAVTVFCALKVRREDDLVAIITPPIAFFLAAITAAQLFLGSAQHSLLNRAVVTFFTLADNWIWIIGATVAALVIVLVRRRR